MLLVCAKRVCRFMSTALTVAVGAMLGVGCATSAPTPPPAPMPQSVNVPVITRQAQTLERQPKGGLEITVVPVSYVPKVVESSTIQPADMPMRDKLIGGTGGGIYVRKTTTSRVGIEPGSLCFLVTVNNKMPRVFHGAGTVLQFNVGGRVMAVSQAGYSTLINGIIPPQQQQQFTIMGPPLTELNQSRGIVGVFLYDVVTQQNAAGAVTEKQNYEWYFDYALTPQTVQLPGTQSQEYYMSVPAYQQWQQAEAMKQSQQQYQLMLQAHQVPAQAAPAHGLPAQPVAAPAQPVVAPAQPGYPAR